MMRKILIVLSWLLISVANIMAQTTDGPVVLRKVPNAQLEMVKDQIRLVLYTDRGGNSLRHLTPNFEVWVDRRQWMAMGNLLIKPSGKTIKLKGLDGSGITVTRMTGVDSAGLLFYLGNKFVNVSEYDFFYLGGVFFNQNYQYPYRTDTVVVIKKYYPINRHCYEFYKKSQKKGF